MEQYRHRVFKINCCHSHVYTYLKTTKQKEYKDTYPILTLFGLQFSITRRILFVFFVVNFTIKLITYKGGKRRRSKYRLGTVFIISLYTDMDWSLKDVLCPSVSIVYNFSPSKKQSFLKVRISLMAYFNNKCNMFETNCLDVKIH